jgi:hypothetical protein
MLRQVRHEIWIGICALALSGALSHSAVNAQEVSQEASAVPATEARGASAGETGSIVSTTSVATVPAEHLNEVEVKPAAKPEPVQSAGKPYFIEFRARSAYNYGHTFLVHGRVGQKITARDVVGLHPATESPTPWMIGHFIPVISETGASDGDYEEPYVIARYRVLLTEPEYKRILAHMRYKQGHSPLWHAVLYNCNRFVGEIAEYMGLRAPFNSLQMPKEYINELRALNGGRKELSGPVREASSARTQETAHDTSAVPAPKPRQAAGNRPQQAAVARQPRAQVTAPGGGSSYAGVN